MPAHTAYQITHVYLNRQHALPHLEHQQGNYLVFWWEEIALGHLFLEPGQRFTEEQLCSKVIEAIKLSVDFYTLRTTEAGTDWQRLFRNNKTGSWTSWMKSVFAAQATKEIPEKVPVSVVICTRNRASELKLCLDSIREMVCQPAEIVVVDNARENDETEQLLKGYPEAVYVEEPTPGLSYARNTGIQHASFPIIAYTDDDVLVHRDWIWRVWETFADPKVAAMAGLVIASELASETQLIFEQHWSFNRGYTDVLYDTAYFESTLPVGPPVWLIGAGANMAFRKQVFEEVGFFDERLGAGASGCSEDSEMWYRILLKGHSIQYNPRAVAFHRHRQDLKALHKQLFSYMRGFAAAALIQQNQYALARYKRHLFITIPGYYGKLLYQGFPRYRFRFKTVLSEISGMFSGIVFYLRNRHKPAYSKQTSV